jgi:hypothetical protein
MSYAYTPGLKVKRETILRKARLLPVAGDVLVKEGDHVSHDTIVAQTHLPGDIEMIPVAAILGVDPRELPRTMLKSEGDTVEKDELIAQTKAFFGLFKSDYRAKKEGVISLISQVTGMIGLQDLPQPLKRDAYVAGKIIEVIPNNGVIVEAAVSFVQGIFGVGGEQHGEIMIIAEPKDIIVPDMIDSDCKDKILVGGSLVTLDTFQKAEEFGVKGIVTGGINSDELDSYLGYEMGVAITGQEDIGLTCIITEGFGEMAMASHTFELLKELEGQLAAINGATQIRAGVIRPEVVVPLKNFESTDVIRRDELAGGMYPGTRVRIIRQPYFGAIGTVKHLPMELQQVETESWVRIMAVQLDNNEVVMIPRANAEIMEE